MSLSLFDIFCTVLAWHCFCSACTNVTLALPPSPPQLRWSYICCCPTPLTDIGCPAATMVQTWQTTEQCGGLSFLNNRFFSSPKLQWLLMWRRSTVWLSTAPTQPLTHWYQVRCLLQDPVFARCSETLVGCVHLRSNTRYATGTRICPCRRWKLVGMCSFNQLINAGVIWWLVVFPNKILWIFWLTYWTVNHLCELAHFFLSVCLSHSLSVCLF